MRRGALAFSSLVASLSASAALARPAPKKEEPAKPPVAIELGLSEHGPDAQWEIELRNKSDKTVRFTDDLRLLSLEVEFPGQEKKKTCRLPNDIVPKEPSSAASKEIRPGGTLMHAFDPRFYCYSAGKQETLVPTAQVVAHYGFPSKTKTRFSKGKRVEETLPDEAPFAFEALDAAFLAPVKNLTSDPVVLDARYAAWSDDDEKKGSSKSDDAAENGLLLEMARGSDAATERSASVTVRLRNPTDHRMIVYLRRAILTFEVVGPHGTTTCAPDDSMRNPDRGAFTRIGPHGSVSLVTRLVEICERGTFAESGLYVVHAKLEATETGSDYGFSAFTGTLKTEKPATIRVRNTLKLIPILRPHSGGGAAAPAPGAPPMPPPGMAMPMPIPPAPPPPPPPPPAPPQ